MVHILIYCEMITPISLVTIYDYRFFLCEENFLRCAVLATLKYTVVFIINYCHHALQSVTHLWFLIQLFFFFVSFLFCMYFL